MSARVDAQVVVGLVAPLLAGVELVVVCASLVDMVDALDELLIAEGCSGLVVCALVFAAAGNFCGHVGVHEQPEGFFFGEDVVCTSSDDDAVGFGGDFPDDGVLFLLDVLVVVGDDRPEGSACVDGEGDNRLLFGDVLNIFLGEGCTFGDLGDDFAVIVSEAEKFGQAAAKFASAGAELAADSNNLVHGYSPLSKY